MATQSSLQSGFPFHPTDDELVSYYLQRKILGKNFRFEAITEVELYKFSPWDLPEKACLKSRDLEWYFYCPRDRKYANGSRTNRATDTGYWKTTGKDRAVIHNSRTVGMKKTLVFHLGKAPRGIRTNWVMHEYRLEDKEWGNNQFSQEAYVVCKIFQKSGPGPKNGEEYGAPFKEEEWEDDTAADNICSFPCASPEPLHDQSAMLEPVIPHSKVSGHAEMSSEPSLPGISDADGIWLEQLAEILNSSPLHSENANQEMLNSPDATKMSGIVDSEEIFNGLGSLSEAAYEDRSSGNDEYALNSTVSELANEHFMELNDLSFLDDGGLPELDMSSDLLAHDSYARYSRFQNLNYIGSDRSDEYALHSVVPEFAIEHYLELNDLDGGYLSQLAVPSDLLDHDSFARFQNVSCVGSRTSIDNAVATVAAKRPAISGGQLTWVPEMDCHRSASNRRGPVL